MATAVARGSDLAGRFDHSTARGQPTDPGSTEHQTRTEARMWNLLDDDDESFPSDAKVVGSVS
ncbi:MAG: hypothetical protein J0I87_10190, partial [Cellulomonas sp.]|nr:hypothetical protein [Cellulomonas sp.]